MSCEKSQRQRPIKIGWGESADVKLLPTLRPDGTDVMTVVRRAGGQPILETPYSLNVDLNQNRFYSLQLAHAVFPEHFIQVSDPNILRVVKGMDGKLQTVPRPLRYFSKYVPLPPESKDEIQGIKDRYRRAHRGELDRDEVVEESKRFDLLMRGRYPELEPTAKSMEDAGFSIPHPEVNFTVHEGKIVFYEVNPINIFHKRDRLEKTNPAIIQAIERVPWEKQAKRFHRILDIYAKALASSQKFLKLPKEGIDILEDLITRAKDRGIIPKDEEVDPLRSLGMSGTTKD